MHGNSPNNEPSVQLTSSIDTSVLIINTDALPPQWELWGLDFFRATVHLQTQLQPNENGLWNFNEQDFAVIIIKTLKQRGGLHTKCLALCLLLRYIKPIKPYDEYLHPGFFQFYDIR